jgi:hypothetical protein
LAGVAVLAGKRTFDGTRDPATVNSRNNQKKSSIEVININQCDTADLIALPGEEYSHRIRHLLFES